MIQFQQEPPNHLMQHGRTDNTNGLAAIRSRPINRDDSKLTRLCTSVLLKLMFVLSNFSCHSIRRFF